MNFLDLKDIAEESMELVNPTSPEKIVHLGRVLALEPGQQVIDFGCGYGEMLALWAQEFGVGGLGIDFRPLACERARQKMSRLGLAGDIEIVCADAADYPFEPGQYDAATCIGASFIWGGFRPSVQQMALATRQGGRLAIGEVYWRHAEVPAALREKEPFHWEQDLLDIAHEEGFEIEYVIRSSRDDWDRYEAGNWLGLMRWLRAHPNHPERDQVLAHLRESQAEYMTYGREFYGWALYALASLEKT
jgi:SAM-dependent methyltransferase